MISLTAGRFRGVPLFTPKGDSTRPSSAKLRQALFNSCQHLTTEEAHILDLYAGSGALGLEALSRGAGRVTFVENANSAAKIIRQNIEKLKVRDRTRVFSQTVEAFLKAESKAGKLSQYDLILVDPPYAADSERLVLETLGKEMKPGAWLYLEWSPLKIVDSIFRADGLPERMGTLVKIREKAYGDTTLTTYESTTDA